MQSNQRPEQNNAVKYSLYVGLALLVALVVLSWVFWRERVLYADAAFQLFSIINGQELAIQVERFGAVIVQYPALFLVRMQAPVSTVMEVYSLSFTVYPLLFALVIWKLLGNARLALVLCLFFALSQVHTFFWIQSELLQGCSYSVLIMAVIHRMPRPPWWLFLLWQLLIVVVVYSHPLSILVLVYLWAWYTTSLRKNLDWRYYSVLLSIGAILVYKFLLVEISDYDTRAIGMLDDSWYRFTHFLALPSTRFFGEKLISTYYFLPVVFLLNVIVLSRQKEWIALGVMVLGMSGWLVLTLTTYHDVFEQMYLESYYLPLGIFLAVPLVEKVMTHGRAWYWLVFLFACSIIRVAQIAEAHSTYHKRLVWLEDQVELMQSYPERRFWLHHLDQPSLLLGLNWGLAYESMLLSSIKGTDEARSLIIAGSPEEQNAILELKNAVKSPFGSHPYDKLNKHYFRIQDTLPPRQLFGN